MRYGSVCSGVEAATVAWHPLGWEPQWFSEIEKFPSAVLQHHYPSVPNFGDMTKFKEWSNDRTTGVDLIVGGPPCQDFSVAGLRAGMAGDRGNLTLTYLDLVAKYRPRWVVYENVPGLLSSNRGRDFGAFLAALGKRGYGFAYRILDAQYFGLAQRRKRVFVVAHIGSWQRAAAVLFEQASLRGDPAPSREAQQEVADAFAVSTTAGGKSRVTKSLTASYGTGGADLETKPLIYENAVKPMALVPPETAAVNHFLAIGNVQDGSVTTLSSREYKGLSCGRDGMTSAAVVAFPANQDAVASNLQVRRLTPIECERLQGFDDDYTRIPWRNKPAKDCPDGPRYKAMGNSMAVPVMRWIGERIQMVDKL